MNRRNNKKGFTIVELVIVIAVIAILAGVLIPTFSSIVTKANGSKALQDARQAYTEYLVATDADDSDLYISCAVSGTTFHFVVADGVFEQVDSAPASGYSDTAYELPATYTGNAEVFVAVN